MHTKIIKAGGVHFSDEDILWKGSFAQFLLPGMQVWVPEKKSRYRVSQVGVELAEGGDLTQVVFVLEVV